MREMGEKREKRWKGYGIEIRNWKGVGHLKRPLMPAEVTQPLDPGGRIEMATRIPVSCLILLTVECRLFGCAEGFEPL